MIYTIRSSFIFESAQRTDIEYNICFVGTLECESAVHLLCDVPEQKTRHFA